MLRDSEIDNAKKLTKDSLSDGPYHERNDCIRIAYEWLDAQVKIKGTVSIIYPVKHLIEKWAGRYVSTADVEVAAFMHPEIRGKYPRFNISARLTEPTIERLSNISEAFSHNYRKRFDPSVYKYHE